MKYSGSGIHVTVRDRNYQTVREEDIAWSQMASDAETYWSYTIPDTDTEVYRYTITYKTEVDTAGELKDFKVSNTAMIEGTDASAASNPGIPIGPGNKLSIKKKSTSVATDKISWDIEINVPAGGYNNAVVTDTYPNSNGYYDSLESITVDGLLDGESYDIDDSNSDKAVITFYKDSAKSEAGLRSNSESRTVVIHVTTNVNQEWLNWAVSEASWALEHSNKADIVVNDNVTDNATATATPKPASVSKTAENEKKNIEIDGISYPAFKYSVIVSGMSGDSGTIEDVFDTDIFRIYDPDTMGGMGEYAERTVT